MHVWLYEAGARSLLPDKRRLGPCGWDWPGNVGSGSAWTLSIKNFPVVIEAVLCISELLEGENLYPLPASSLRSNGVIMSVWCLLHSDSWKVDAGSFGWKQCKGATYGIYGKDAYSIFRVRYLVFSTKVLEIHLRPAENYRHSYSEEAAN